MSNLPIREVGAVFCVGVAFLILQIIMGASPVQPMEMLPLLAVSAALWLLDAVLMGRRDYQEKELYRAIMVIGDEMSVGSPLETAVHHAAQRKGSAGAFFSQVVLDAQQTNLSQAFHKAAREANTSEASEAAYLLSLVAWSNRAGGSAVRWMGEYLEKIQLAEEEMKAKLAMRMLTFRGLGVVVVPFVSAALAKSMSTTGRFVDPTSIMPDAALVYFSFVAIALAFVEGIVFQEWLRAPYKVPAYLCAVHLCTFWV
jgi:hypothetical protein